MLPFSQGVRINAEFAGQRLSAESFGPPVRFYPLAQRFRRSGFGLVTEERVDPRQRPKGGLRPSPLPVVHRALANAQDLSYFQLRKPKFHPSFPDMLPVSPGDLRDSGGFRGI